MWKNNTLTAAFLLSIVFSFVAHAYDDKDKAGCDNPYPRYVFSWALSDECNDKPRGGSSKGVEPALDPEPHSGWAALREPGLSQFEKDRLAILAMAGPYRVDFDFLETVGFSEDYKRDRPYHSWGTEYIYVLEDQPQFISLQHIMVLHFENEEGQSQEPVVIKHWRQDWRYEDDELLVYDHHNQWKKQKVPEGERSGRWSQAVFQVDDSPRYESMGRWYHNGSFSAWRSDRTTRPLPRREYSVRDDYDVLIGYNRHTINRFGWVQEEENWKKALHGDGSSKEYLAKEEGIGRYRRITGTDFSAGDNYMQVLGPFWADVRAVWDTVYAQADRLSLHAKRDEKALYTTLFEFADEIMKQGKYDSATGKAFAEKTINSYIMK